MPQKPLSPEQYIKTRARTLPVYKCYLNADWKEGGLANVVVVRKHVTGNFTIGVYLVDLLCLGVKDTMVLFNVEPEKLEKYIDTDAYVLQEAEYNLVHNIVFAGLEYAQEFDIAPHNDFALSKFILEDDDEKIPLIDIETGDETGNPQLIVPVDYNYAPILKKLEKHAGKGNYTFEILDNLFEEGDGDDDAGEDEVEDYLPNEAENGHLDFEHVADMNEEGLTKIVDEKTRLISDQYIALSEMLLRQLDKWQPGYILNLASLRNTRPLQLFEKGFKQWVSEDENSVEEIEPIWNALVAISAEEQNSDSFTSLQRYLPLLDKYSKNSYLSYFIFTTIPAAIIMEQTGYLAGNVHRFNEALQILITCYATLQSQRFTQLKFIDKASDATIAFPLNETIHALHHKSFWLLKAILALINKDRKEIIFYHNVLRVTGTPPQLRFLYMLQLTNWLKEELEMGKDRP